ncbi:methyltransferase domain-containing protein [Verrucomicrobiota bacterium]
MMIAAKVHFYFKVLQFLMRGKVVQPNDITADYNRLSPTYDEFFSRYVGKHSRNLIEKMNLRKGSRVLDLASGTGTLTLAIAEQVGPTGTVIGIDRSRGMINVAEDKAESLGLKNIRFVKGDISDAVESFPDESFDAVTCGWAIGYVDPDKLLKTIKLKLKRGGKVGLIENRRKTLESIRRTCMRVAQTYPRHMNNVMDLHFRLPRNKSHLNRLFRSARLKPLRNWEGEERFLFNNGAEVLDWVLHTGASAGFDKMMSCEIKPQCDECFVRYIEEDFMKDGSIEVAHCFAAGMAEKG